jgi:signal transduction histidine kinase
MIRFRSAGLGLLGIACGVWSSCNRSQASRDSSSPSIEFTSVPLAQPGAPDKLNVVRGRVAGAQPNQRVVLYARSGFTWRVQPFADRPFTMIQPDSTWASPTHPGLEFAALLVGPEFRVMETANSLPTEGVVASAVTKGLPRFWVRWWFFTICGLALLLAAFGLHRLLLKQMADKLNVRFEERLAERTRVAQLLHDTLLQGVVSASMQLHVAVDQLPPDSPMLPPLHRVLRSMGQMVEEGRNTLQAFEFPQGLHDLERSLSHIPQELGLQGASPVRVIVTGTARPLQSGVGAEVNGIGREAVIHMFRQSHASQAEVELRYTARELRLFVRDDGGRTDPQVSSSGRENLTELAGVRSRAERIGARLKVRRRRWGRNEVELRIPGHVAFEFHEATPRVGWLAALRRWVPPRDQP